MKFRCLSFVFRLTEVTYFAGVSAELVRTDLRDGEDGIPYFSEYQIIDVTTCDPIPNVYVDTWHGQLQIFVLWIHANIHIYIANSTGVYAGVVASGNGDITDESNLVCVPSFSVSEFVCLYLLLSRTPRTGVV